MGNGRWTESEVKKLKHLMGEYSSYKNLVEHFDRSEESLKSQASNRGLKLKPNVNEEFFYKKDEVSYYILGYWFADGCIMKKSGGYYFSIVSNDIGHLERIKTEMEVQTKIYENSNDAHELRVGNKKLVQNMIKDFKAKYNKTHTAKIPHDIIPEKHFYDFLRGYFDGDGSIRLQDYVRKDGTKGLSNIKFTGAENIIKSLYKYINGGTLSEDSRKNDCFYLSFYGDGMRNLLKKMYSNSKIYLKRKYKLFDKRLNEV